ncbi:hypothetical protein JCM9279_005519 [Rhodotorula babjevae]
MSSPSRPGAPQAHAPRPFASTTAATTTTTTQPWTDSPAQLTPTSDPASPSLASTHLRPRPPISDPTLTHPANLLDASTYAHQAQGEALFGPPPRSPVVAPPPPPPPRSAALAGGDDDAHTPPAHERERARLRSKYALKPEQEEVLGRMMQGVWERLGGESQQGGAAQLSRAQGDRSRAAPPETPDLSSLAPSKAASPAQPALSLPNSPPSTRTSLYDARGDAWAAEERVDLRRPAGARTPFASTTPLDSPPIVMTPVGSPRSTHRSRPPSPLPLRSSSVSPPPSPPPGAASPRPADRTLTPMPSPPVAPSAGASFPHLERERPALFRALGWSYLPARSGLRTQRAPLVDGELGVEEREWAERTRRVPDDGGLRDWWGNPVGLGGGDWGRAVLSPIVTETEPTHSSPALSFRSGASYISRSSTRRRDPQQQHYQQWHRRTVSVPLEELEDVEAGSERSAASRSARLERGGPRSPRSPLSNGLVAPAREGSAVADSEPPSRAFGDVSSFAMGAKRQPSEPFFAADPSLASRRSRLSDSQPSLDQYARPYDETSSRRLHGTSILTPGVEYDPSLTAADYAHAGLPLDSPRRDDSFFLGAEHEWTAPGAASTTSRRSRAASSTRERLSALPASSAAAHTPWPTAQSMPSQLEHDTASRAARSSNVGAHEDDAAGRESSSPGPAPNATDEHDGALSRSVDTTTLRTSSAAPSSSRRASRPPGPPSRTDPVLYGDTLDSPSRLPSSSSSRSRLHHVDEQSSLRRADAVASSRHTLRSPSLDDRSLAQPSFLDSPSSRPRERLLDSPSSRSTTYSTATGAAWASPPMSPLRGALSPRRGSSGAASRSWTPGAAERTSASPSSLALDGQPERVRRERGGSTSGLGDSGRTSTLRASEALPPRNPSSSSSSKDDISRWASGVVVGAGGETSEPSQASSTERAGRSGGSSRSNLVTPSSGPDLDVDGNGQHAGSTLSPRRASHRSTSCSPTKSSAPGSSTRASGILSPTSTAPTPSEYVSAVEDLSASGQPSSVLSRRRTVEGPASSSCQRSPPPSSSPFFGATSRSLTDTYSPRADPARSIPSTDVLSPESSLFGIGSPASTPPQRRPLLAFGPSIAATDSSSYGGVEEPVGVGREGLERRRPGVPNGPDLRADSRQSPLDQLETSSTPTSPPLVSTVSRSPRSPIKPHQPSPSAERYPPPSPRFGDWDDPPGSTAHSSVAVSEELQGYDEASVVSPHEPPRPSESSCSSPSRSVYSSSGARGATEPAPYVARRPVKPARRGPGPYPVPQLSEEEKQARRELRKTGRCPEWDLPVSETKSGRRAAAWNEMQAFEKERARLFKLLGEPLSAQDVPVLNALAGLYLDSSNSAVRAQAIQLLQNSLQLDDMQPETARLLALQLEDDDIEEALTWHRFAVERGPESPERHLSLGHCLLRADNPSEASHVFLTVARSFTDEPYEAIALYELGRLYQQHGAGGPAERANAIEAFEGALACLTRLRLESPETRLGERWDELELVERAVLRGLQEVRDGQRGPSASPFSSKHATPRGPLSPVASTKLRLPPPPRQPAAAPLATPTSSMPSPPCASSSPSSLPQHRRQPGGVIDVAPPSRSPTVLNEAVSAIKPVRPPRRQRRKVDSETAQTLDTILSSLSRLSRMSPAAELANSTRNLAKQVERTYIGLKVTSGKDSAQQDDLLKSLDEVQRALDALPDKLVSQAKLIAARPSRAPPPPPTAHEHDPLKEVTRKLERARRLAV